MVEGREGENPENEGGKPKNKCEKEGGVQQQFKTTVG